jgi:hypothetical protein
MWELFQLHSDFPAETPEAELYVVVSREAITGKLSVKTLKLQGLVQDKLVTILIDSGSSHTFISQNLASQLSGGTPVDTPISVQVANGTKLTCQLEFKDSWWSVQHCCFQSTLKVLPLQFYDMIVGTDWLDQFSPMQVHWQQKWMLIPYEGQWIKLQGELPLDYEETMLEVHFLLKDFKAADIPPPIQALIDKYGTVFQPLVGLPPSRSCDHGIPLIAGAQPFVIRPYRYPPALKTEIEAQIANMLAEGIIRPSSSPFSSSVVMTRKKDGTWHFCVDYRFLNVLTIKSKYPVPIIDEFLDELSKACWFTKLDLRSGFHQILFQAGEEYKTAFSTHSGQYEFLVMPFGVTGGPGTFQSAMNTTLASLLRICVLVFLDDILTYSSSFEDHLMHIEAVLQLLAKDGWKVKPSKCTFAQQSIAYLGHVISADGVSTDPAKIRDVQVWPQPTSVKELRSFLGLSGYYRKFVKHYGIISKPLTNLLKKGELFVWTAETETAFQTLKQALVSAPVLALPDFSLPFAIEIDACVVGIGAVLTQKGHPLAYVRKALGPKTQGLSTYEKSIWLSFWPWSTGELICSVLSSLFILTRRVWLNYLHKDSIQLGNRKSSPSCWDLITQWFTRRVQIILLLILSLDIQLHLHKFWLSLLLFHNG